MLAVLVLAVALWAIGAAMGAPRPRRWIMIALLIAVVILCHLTLPQDHFLRVNTGGSVGPWALLLGFAGLVLAYRWGLRQLKQREVTISNETPTKTFSDTEQARYARHMVLRDLGGPAQKKLKNAKVLVVGAGGLGSPVLMYLAAAGVGTIGVIDDDVVDNSNLQRQVIHDDADIGKPKVFSAKAAMTAQNPFVTVRPYHRKLTADIASELFADYDLIIDGTDNFDTRYLVNRTAVAAGIPLVSGALAQWEGQISIFDPAQGAPCYECVFPTAPDPELAPSCAAAGVLGPLPGVIGTMMAVEAIKLITNAGTALQGELQIYDALHAETRKISVKRRDDCAVCGGSN